MTHVARRSCLPRVLALALVSLFTAGAMAAQVAKPTFEPAEGAFTEKVEVEIKCDTNGATIRYVTGDKTLSDRSPEYRKPIPITATTTIKAQAFKDGMKDSEAVEATYTLEVQRVAKPELDPGSKTFTGSVIVEMKCATPEAVIHYTVDGKEPTEDSPRFDRLLVVDQTRTVKARAFREGWDPSEKAEATYTKKVEKVATPTFDPSGNRIFDDELRVKITCETKDATIRYTLNGDTPTKSSRVYKEPIVLIDETTITARAFREDGSASEAAAAHYTERVKQVATPRFEPRGNSSYTGTLRLKITCGTPGATIRYTTNGDEPGPRSDEYRGPIELEKTAVVNAQGFKEGYKDSEIIEGKFTRVLETVATPVLEPGKNGMEFKGRELVTIKCETRGAKIYYTLDGSDPDEDAIEYKGTGIVIDKSVTIRVRAYKEDMAPSKPEECLYIRKLERVATPKLEPSSPRTFEGELTIKLTCATEKATIRYTTNGDEPRESSKEYKEPIVTMDTVTLRAKAFKPEWLPSEEAIGKYTEHIRTVARPEYAPDKRYFQDEMEVKLTCDTDKATIRFTTNGDDPKADSPPYKEPIKLEKTTRLKARAYLEDWEPSPLLDVTFEEKNGRVEAIEFNPTGKEFDKSLEVKLSCETEGATIYYTLDGNIPTARSTPYRNPVKLTQSATIKAIGIKQDWADSEIKSQGYTLKLYPCKDPEFDPRTCEFTGTLEVEIDCDTPDVKIYYTLDGDPPTERDELYRDRPIKLTKTTTIKARAYKEGMLPSKEVVEKYTLK